MLGNTKPTELRRYGSAYQILDSATMDSEEQACSRALARMDHCGTPTPQNRFVVFVTRPHEIVESSRQV